MNRRNSSAAGSSIFAELLRLSLPLTLIAILISQLPSACANPYQTQTRMIIESPPSSSGDMQSTRFATAMNESQLPQLMVHGNQLEDASGKQVILRGVSLFDWNLTQNPFPYLAQSWNVRLVRIPIDPGKWAEQSEMNLTSVDMEVSMANEYGIYAIIDWHAIGNITNPNATGDTPRLRANLTQTEAFWATIAQHFSGRTGILYEIYNEPARITWSQWQPYAQKIVNLIRKYDNNTTLLVSGVSWSFDLSAIPNQPVSGSNIAYVVHPYPNRCHYSDACWNSNFGNITRLSPLFATEWGYYTEDQSICDTAATFGWNWPGYGTRLVTYMASRNMSWTAWAWAPNSCPSLLLSSNMYQPSQYGQFVQTTLLGHSPGPNSMQTTPYQSSTQIPPPLQSPANSNLLTSLALVTAIIIALGTLLVYLRRLTQPKLLDHRRES